MAVHTFLCYWRIFHLVSTVPSVFNVTFVSALQREPEQRLREEKIEAACGGPACGGPANNMSYPGSEEDEVAVFGRPTMAEKERNHMNNLSVVSYRQTSTIYFTLFDAIAVVYFGLVCISCVVV